MQDPFTVLGVPADADDAAIKRRYLELVRAHPPEQDPERFQLVRAAFETLRSRRDRLAFERLHTGGGALTALKRRLLEPAAGQATGRASQAAVAAVVQEALARKAAAALQAAPDSHAADGDK